MQILILMTVSVPGDDFPWERFLSNAKRVRVFYFKTLVGPVPPSWMVVASQCPGGILFPSLRDLSYHSTSDIDWPWLTVLAAPTLQALDLDFDSPNPSSPNPDGIITISNLPQRCPAIRKLTFRDEFTPVRLCSDLICCWMNLHHIRLPTCDSRALTHVSLMDNLSELVISFLSPPPYGHVTFSALQTLRLGTGNFNY
jgi:hypothetical protein